jgi:hypothetical protein
MRNNYLFTGLRTIKVFANWSGVAGDHLPVVPGLLRDVHYVEVAAAVAPSKGGFLRQE